MTFDKVRIRFRKDGDLRLVSHHDLMRAFERMLRRADLPFRSTEGFHPQPRVVFAQSLPLGVAGLAEVVEIVWTEPVEPEIALARLNAQAPAGIAFLSAKRIDLRQSARPRRAVYRLALPPSPLSPPPGLAGGGSVWRDGKLSARCIEVIAASELWVERARPRPREVNIRPYIKSLRYDNRSLEIDLWITPDGGARADEIVRALGLQDLLDAGSAIERIELELADEVDSGEGTAAPCLPSREQRAAYERPLNRPVERPESKQPVHAAHWGASPSGPIVE
jgi:radical SAM-linked protein